MQDILTTRKQRQRAAEMLNDLSYQTHSVVLIPAPDPKHSGHKIRAVENSNPAWYSELAARFTSIRGIGPKRYDRPRTQIKRGHVTRALNRIVENRAIDSDYCRRLLAYIDEILNREAARKLSDTAELTPDPPGTWPNDAKYPPF